MRYQRNIPALSEAECALLRGKTIAVIGCGGLGGYLMEYLARIGVGCIRCVDGDVFEESNLNRQLLSSVSLLGAGKAQVAADRIADINPDIQVQAFPVFLDAANVSESCVILAKDTDHRLRCRAGCFGQHCCPQDSSQILQ